MPTGTAFITAPGDIAQTAAGLTVSNAQPPKSLVLWEASLGELDLQCDAGYIVTSVDLGFPEVREVTFEMAYMNGVWDETGFYGASAISIGLGLDGAKAPVQMLLDQLRSYVLPDKRPRLRYLPSGYTTPREMILRGKDCQAVFDNPRVMACVAQWVNPDGRSFEYLPDSPNGFRCADFGFSIPGGRTYDRPHDWTYPPGITNSVNVVNAGNASSPWTMTIFGPVSAPRIDMLNAGLTFTVDLNRVSPLVIPAGGWVTIDSRMRTVVDNTGANLYANLLSALLPALPIGTTTLSARSSPTAPAPAAVEFCYRSAWV